MPWMIKRTEIEEELADARHALSRTWTWRAKALAEGQDTFLIENEWKTAQNRFRQTAKDLNQRINDLNLEVPADQFMRGLVFLEREIHKLQ